MTLTQIAEDAGCSYRTVKTTAKMLWPGSDFKQQAPTDEQVKKLMATLPKRNIVEGNSALSVGNSALSDDRIERLETLMAAQIGMVEHLCKALAAIPIAMANQRQAIPEIVQDYFTIKGYAGKIGVPVTYSEAITIGRSAAKLSRETGKEIHKADDERFGQVNSYHIEVLREVFQS